MCIQFSNIINNIGKKRPHIESSINRRWRLQAHTHDGNKHKIESQFLYDILFSSQDNYVEKKEQSKEDYVCYWTLKRVVLSTGKRPTYMQKMWTCAAPQTTSNWKDVHYNWCNFLIKTVANFQCIFSFWIDCSSRRWKFGSYFQLELSIKTTIISKSKTKTNAREKKNVERFRSIDWFNLIELRICRRCVCD